MFIRLFDDLFLKTHESLTSFAIQQGHVNVKISSKEFAPSSIRVATLGAAQDIRDAIDISDGGPSIKH